MKRKWKFLIKETSLSDLNEAAEYIERGGIWNLTDLGSNDHQLLPTLVTYGKFRNVCFFTSKTGLKLRAIRIK